MSHKEDETEPVPSPALSTSIFSFLTGRCWDGASEELAREVFSGVLENVDLPRLSLDDARFLLKQVNCNRKAVIKCLNSHISRWEERREQHGEQVQLAWLALDYLNTNSWEESYLSSAADLEKVWSVLHLLLQALRFGNVDGVGIPDSFSPIAVLLQLGVLFPTRGHLDYTARELPLDQEGYYDFAGSVHCIIKYVAQQTPHLLGLANEEGKTPLHFAVVSCFSPWSDILEYEYRNCSSMAEVDAVEPEGAGGLLVPAIITACPDSALAVDNNGNSALHVLVDFVLRTGFSEIPLGRFHSLLRKCPKIVAIPRRNGRFPLIEIFEYNKGISYGYAHKVFFLIGMFLRACKSVGGGVGTLTSSGILDLFVNFLPNFDLNDHMDSAFDHCIEQMTAVFEVAPREPTQPDGIQCLFKVLDAIARLHDAIETLWEDEKGALDSYVDNNGLIASIEQFARKAVIHDCGESGLEYLQMPNSVCSTKYREWIFQFTGRIGYQGRYLLHTAAATGSPIVQKLASANPGVISRKDPGTGLYPFQAAAASSGDLAGLNNTYLLLIKNPGVVSALTDGGE